MVNQTQADCVMKCRETLDEAIKEMCNGTDRTRFLSLVIGVAEELLSVSIQVIREKNQC